MSKDPYEFSQKYNILPAVEPDVLPVPVGEWDRIMTRIKQCKCEVSLLTSFGWFCLGAFVALAVVAWQFPATAQYSIVIGNTEAMNKRAYATEIAAIALAILFLLVGLVTLYHAWDKAKMQSRMTDLIIDDMQELKSRHWPRIHKDSAS